MNFARITIAVAILTFALVIFVYGQKPSQQIADVKGEKIILNESPQLQKYPQRNDSWVEFPQISAKSALVTDVKSAKVLYEKNPNDHLLPASTTKLLTALVALERCSQEQQVTVGFIEPQPSAMGLSTGDTVTVQTLLYGLLVASGNDAAFALALACTPSVEDFVGEMNLKSKELAMNDSHFTNPAGFDSENHYSTASDLAKLARVAVANPLIAKIVATKSIVLTDSLNTKTYYLENINKLLGQVKGISGIKTGQTEGSLEVLITQTTRDAHTIITVVLGSTDRFTDSENLIEWTFTNHNWVYL